MSGQKIVLVVLILLALLYIAGAGMGLRGGSRSLGMDWVEDLSGALTPRLEFEKLQGACLNREASSFVVTPKKPCEVQIPGFQSGTRKMTLRLAAGAQVDGQYLAPARHEKIDKADESARQDFKLEPEKKLSLVILKEGGTLSLRCDNQEKRPCRVDVK